MSEPLTLNVPTDEGRALGAELARIYVTLKCQAGAEDERCHDCAFRLGSYPNGCPGTVATALECLLEFEPFYCHHGMQDGEPKRLCKGYEVIRDSKTL